MKKTAVLSCWRGPKGATAMSIALQYGPGRAKFGQRSCSKPSTEPPCW